LELGLGFGSARVALIFELKIHHVLPNFYFVNKQVSLGSSVGAYRSGRHTIKISADGTSYQGKAVKLDLDGASSSGQIVPNDWQLLVPDAEFFYDTSKDAHGEAFLKFSYEKEFTPAQVITVTFTPSLPYAREFWPDREKFIHGELGYYLVKVVSVSNREIPMAGVDVTAGVDDNLRLHMPSDKDGIAKISINYPQGNYVLKGYVRLPGGEPEPFRDIPFIVHSK
jgi:hypothetical protein